MNINVRVSEELAQKLDETITKLEVVAQKGTEVSRSSIIRAGLEQFIESVEKEENNIVSLDIPVDLLDTTELKTLQTTLKNVYKSAIDREVDKNQLLTMYLAETGLFLELNKRERELEGDK